MNLRHCLLVIFVLLVSACRHPLAILGEGDIVDVNSHVQGCSYEDFLAGASTCVDNDVQGDYNVAYLGVARPGFRFTGWDGPCGHLSTGPYCTFLVGGSLVALWDADFGHILIPATTAQFAALTQADAGLDSVGAFAISSASGAAPTASFVVGLDGVVSWSRDYSAIGQGTVTASGPVDTFGQFSFDYTDPTPEIGQVTLQGSFIDRDYLGGRILDKQTGMPVAFFSGTRIDQFPDDPTEDTDSDGDGVGNNSDQFPDDPSRSEDNSEAFYLEKIAGPVVGSRCLTCHFTGGLADQNGADLLFATPGTPNQDALNLQVFRDYVATSAGAKNVILNKAQGLAAHGGGVIFRSNTQQFMDLSEFLDLL